MHMLNYLYYQLFPEKFIVVCQITAAYNGFPKVMPQIGGIQQCVPNKKNVADISIKKCYCVHDNSVVSILLSLASCLL